MLYNHTKKIYKYGRMDRRRMTLRDRKREDKKIFKEDV
jgi:hypothetical protein